MVKETSGGLGGSPGAPKAAVQTPPRGRGHPAAPREPDWESVSMCSVLKLTWKQWGRGALSEYSQVSPRAAEKGLARGSQARPPAQTLAPTSAPPPSPRPPGGEHDAHFAWSRGGLAAAGAAAPRGFQAWPQPWPRTEPEPRAALPGPPPSEGLGGWEQAGAVFGGMRFYLTQTEHYSVFCGFCFVLICTT